LVLSDASVVALLCRFVRLIALGKGLQGIARQIMSLAEVYEHLLGVGIDGQIDIGAYVTALCANLPDLQTPSVSPISLRCDVESMRVPLASATALDPALTKLISNSHAHAFADRGGTISASVKRGDEPDQGVIKVADDGVGAYDWDAASRCGGTPAHATGGGHARFGW
jgi:two-component sensor histidine kinase